MQVSYGGTRHRVNLNKVCLWLMQANTGLVHVVSSLFSFPCVLEHSSALGFWMPLRHPRVLDVDLGGARSLLFSVFIFVSLNIFHQLN